MYFPDVTIPSSVTTIGYGAFSTCASLTDVYYGGSEAAWERITISEWNEPLTSATIHYNSASSAPSTSSPPSVANIAYASAQEISVDGTAVQFDAYALKDANGYDTNYVKLRDVAHTLNGTAAQFDVGWDGSISLTTGVPYSSNGSEMSTPFSGNRAYQTSSSAIRINGKDADLEAILLTDDEGNGYTYFKLRDLGAALGFTVDWSAERGIYIETK